MDRLFRFSKWRQAAPFGNPHAFIADTARARFSPAMRSTTAPTIIFGCDECGSPQISVPARVTDDAVVNCGHCGLPRCSWIEYRAAIFAAVAGAAAVPAELLAA
ncbi:hypothetical protein AB6806_10940 [Bosea sp. RCC_152_1]|uniref:hypothetical protein n=1 Tax=Bosea sp. RCC_152_1 TaxID=3239228 RepID=UPI0035263F29